MSEPFELTAGELLAAYRAFELSPVEVVADVGARTEAMNPRLNAFETVTLERAASDAKEAEVAWRGGTARSLEGVPFGVKDLFDTAGVRTTYGSPMFDQHVPAKDAVAVARILEAGGLLVGKTSTDEFAYGIAGVNPHTAPSATPGTRNGSPAGRAVAPGPLSQRGWCRSRSVATRAARFGLPPPTVASSG